MKRIIALILILTIFIMITPSINSAKEEERNGVTYDNIVKANQLINSEIVRKAIRSEDFLFWNFYISADSNALTAYGYRFADALYNLDFLRSINFSTINKDDALEVMEDFICAYTQQNQQNYDTLAKAEGILQFLDYGADAAENLSKAGAFMKGYDEISLKKAIQELTPWKEKLELCVARGTVDDKTMAWILGGELQRTTDTLNLTQTFDTLCAASSMLANGLEVVSYVNDLDQRIQTLNTLKYAAGDSEKVLRLLSNTSIDKNIKEAAITLRKSLQIYKNAGLQELAIMAVGDTTKNYAQDHVMDAIKDLSIQAIRNNGLKGIATGSLIGLEAGVAVSNVLFNTGGTMQQVNKIRVLALISSELCSKLVDVQSEFIFAFDDMGKRAKAADEVSFYVPALLFARQIGEQQYYNLMKSQQSGIAAQLISLFQKPQTNLEDWYSNMTAYLNELQIQTNNILDCLPKEADESLKGEETGGADKNLKEEISRFLAMFNGFEPFDNPNQINKGKVVSLLAYASGVDWNSLSPDQKKILGNHHYDAFAPLANIEKTAQRLLSPEITLPQDYDYNRNVMLGYGDGWLEELRGVGFSGHGLGSYSKEVFVIDISMNDKGQYVTNAYEISVVGEDEYMSLNGDIYQGDKKIGTVKRDSPEVPYTYYFDVDLESLQSHRYVLKPNASNTEYGLQIISKSKN